MGHNKKSNGSLVLYVLSFLILVCRGETVGIDTENYYNNRFLSDSTKDSMSLEWLFLCVSEIITNIGLSPRFCIYFLAFISMFFLYNATVRYKVDASRALFFYILFGYYTHSFNIARQMAACCIMLYAYSYIIPIQLKQHESALKNKIYFVLYTILAASIHVSAFLFLSILLITKANYNVRNISPVKFTIVLCSVFAILQIAKEVFLSQMMGLINIVTLYEDVADAEVSSLSFFGFFYRCLVYIIAGFVFAKIRKNVNNRALLLFVASLLFRIILSTFYGNIYRIGLYLSIFDVIIYARVYDFLKIKERFYYFIFIAYFSFEYFSAHTGNIYGTNPYVFEMIEIF